jgi:2,3-dihydro-2,3-dihydroxybenzoate dehydrogenase
MSDRFKNKHCLVVGACGGMGRAITLQLAAEGASIVATDIDLDSLQDLQRELNAVSAIAKIDLARIQESTLQLNQLCAQQPAFDVVVFAAGIFAGAPFLETTDELVQKLFAVNVFGALRVLRAVGASMKSNGGGSIVVLASQSSAVVRMEQAAYGASKAALTYLTKVAGLELAAHGIRCNVVQPGVTETPLATTLWAEGKGSASAHIEGDLARYRVPIPLRRVAQPNDVAEAVLFLASDAARHISMTELIVDGGSALRA